MSNSQLLLAARNLTRHRTRTFISASAVAVGVIAVLLAGGFTEWIFWAIREAAIQTGLGHIQITRPGFREAGFADPMAFVMPSNAQELEVVRSAPAVKVVDQRLALTGLVSSGETTIPFTAEAVDPDADRLISKVLPVSGSNLSASDSSAVLLGRGLADALGVKPGDGVILIVSLPGGGMNAVDARMSGIFSTDIKAYDDSAIRMPLALGRELLRIDGSHIWTVGLDRTDDTASTMKYLSAHLPPGRFELASWFDLSDFYRKSVVLLSRQIEVVSVLIGLIIVFSISNTLTMNVLERTGEIGTLMALGTPRRRILGLFVLEGFFIGLIGGLAGLGIGCLLAQVLSYVGIPMPPPPGREEAYSAQIMLTLPLAFWAFAMAVVSTTVASLYPAWKAARLPIVDALRHNQ
jgi:putative ABC transport system permease protein